jgi:hypothetical protein
MLRKNVHKIKVIIGKVPIMLGLLALAALMLLRYDASQAALPATSSYLAHSIYAHPSIK